MSATDFTQPSLEEMSAMLPNYEFESQLCANHVGAVYYAHQKALERHVAMKVFAPAMGRDDRFMACFKLATAAVAGLRHPNLIGLIDSGVAEGMPYLVMEFVPGKSLHRSTHGHAIEFKQSMAIIKEVCDGLAYAHANGVIHGNLSPLNILLNQKASPKIGNFALGRAIHTLPGISVPTHFTAPEVLAGEAHSKASDIYSLGAMFYELITATPYRTGAPPASEMEGSPKGVDAVIAKATAADPSTRFQGANEFYEALEKAATRKPKPPPSPVDTRKTAMELAKSTTGTGIAVKIVIILALLIAIQQVWGYRKQVEAKRRHALAGAESQPAGTTEATGTTGTTQITSFEMTRQQRQAKQREVVEPETEDSGFPEVVETPMDSFERLSDALKAGMFTELPKGAVTQGSSHFFLVEEPMTWREALAHAEEHGGTIALPDGDIGWSKQPPFNGRQFWLGAARSGAKEYTLLDGRAWQPAATLIGTDPWVYLDEAGQFKTASPSTKLPYVIQWIVGAKPTSLEARLMAAASTIRAGQPAYPPETWAQGERRYLVVDRATNWEEANKLAQSAGGHLFVLSAPQENLEREAWVGRLKQGASYWMGGQLAGERWQWVTGEPWGALDWMDIKNAAENDAAMILRAGAGIDAMGRAGSADGFIIEWSKDAETNKPQPGQEPPPLASTTELAEMAKQLVAKAIADKEAAHTKNTDKVAWDLNAHLRGLKKSDFDLWAPEAEKLKGCVQNNRLLKETVDNSGVRLSPFMAILCNFVIRKQGEIDVQHVASLRAIHASYLKKLADIRDQAKARGQVKTQSDATRLIDESQNFDAWIDAMSVAAP